MVGSVRVSVVTGFKVFVALPSDCYAALIVIYRGELI
jgi:hypothetical protein